MKSIRATVWNEYRHEKQDDEIAALYPEGIHGTISAFLSKQNGISATTATLDEPEHGLTEDVLANTDVLIWWSHMAQDEVATAIVDRVQQHVLAGMGLIVLHSGALSKIFTRLLGTHCSFRWREIGEKERLWNIAPSHAITQGMGDYFEIPHTEMYGERFDIPEPNQTIFLSWFEGGEVFRSGCTWFRGNGKIFYFRPGHETLPIYYQNEVVLVIANAVRWAAPLIRTDIADCTHVAEPIERVESSE